MPQISKLSSRLPRPVARAPISAWRMLGRFNSMGLSLTVPVYVLGAITFLYFLGPMIGHLPAPINGNLSDANLPMFSPGHLLGTDPLGNDYLSRSLYGGRVSLEVGVGAVAIGFFIGSCIGTVAGYFGSKVDSFLMRVIDVFLAFPSLVLTMCMAAVLGPSERNEIIAVSVFAIPNYARLARAATLKIRNREFVLVGQIMGASPGHMMRKHIFRNIVPGLLTVVPVTIAIAMVIEATLSFLGLGIRPPAPSLGNMIAQGQQYISSEPRLIIVPAIFLALLVTCFNLIGEQLRIRSMG